MIQETVNKYVQAALPQILDNAALTAIAIDTKGFRQLRVSVLIGATDIALTVLKLQESDDGTTYTDIPGSLFGATGAPALPGATADGTQVGWDLNLIGRRKRFVRLTATAGDGTAGIAIAAIGVLSRPEENAITATERGFASEIVL
jgi:hypothetical protein